jgi:hypothetical protein
MIYSSSSWAVPYAPCHSLVADHSVVVSCRRRATRPDRTVWIPAHIFSLCRHGRAHDARKTSPTLPMVWPIHFLQWPSGTGKKLVVDHSVFNFPCTFCSIALRLLTVTYIGLFQQSNKSYFARVILECFCLSNALWTPTRARTCRWLDGHRRPNNKRTPAYVYFFMHLIEHWPARWTHSSVRGTVPTRRHSPATANPLCCLAAAPKVDEGGPEK